MEKVIKGIKRILWRHVYVPVVDLFTRSSFVWNDIYSETMVLHGKVIFTSHSCISVYLKLLMIAPIFSCSTFSLKTQNFFIICHVSHFLSKLIYFWYFSRSCNTPGYKNKLKKKKCKAILKELRSSVYSYKIVSSGKENIQKFVNQ